MDKKTLQVILQDHPVAYHPILAKATGSVNAAILLSQLLYWQGKGDNPEWTYKTRDEIYEETGLSRREQETARRHLGLLHILHERRAGVPARIYYHVDMDALVEVLAAYQQKTADKAEPSSVSDPEMRPAEDTEDTVQLAQNVPSSWHKMYHLDGTKCTNWMAQNVPTNTESTTETTTETTTEREHDKSSQAQEQMNPSLSLDRDNVTCADATQPSRSSLAEDEDNRNTQTSRIQTDGVTDDVVSSLPRGSPGALFDEIMTVCQHSEHTITPMIAKHILEAGNRLAAQGATSDDVRLFAEYWRTCDWRGKKGDPIEPRNIIAEWRRFTEWRDRRAIVAEWDGWIERRMPMPT